MPGPRQDLSDPDLLTCHPPHLTDGWVLTIKLYSLMGRISLFYRRLELQHHAEVFKLRREPDNRFYALHPTWDFLGGKGYWPLVNKMCTEEVRRLPKFSILDSSITGKLSSHYTCEVTPLNVEDRAPGFRLSLPAEYRDPFKPVSWNTASNRWTSSLDVDCFLLHCGLNAYVFPAMSNFTPID